MTAEPREGLRDTEPYVSPQLPVAARLNTNECPHPLPESFFDELADAIRDVPLNRYPDGSMRRLREELATVVAGRDLARERIERDPPAAAPGLRRARPPGAPVRTHVPPASPGRPADEH
jgi:hypothetical protein